MYPAGLSHDSRGKVDQTTKTSFLDLGKRHLEELPVQGLGSTSVAILRKVSYRSRLNIICLHTDPAAIASTSFDGDH